MRDKQERALNEPKRLIADFPSTIDVVLSRDCKLILTYQLSGFKAKLVPPLVNVVFPLAPTATHPYISVHTSRQRRVQLGKMSAVIGGARALPVLDVGCGINKYPGSIGLDSNPNTRADVIADLDQFPFPFRDDSFREIRAIHVIEHVGNVIRFMEEVHRLLTPGGRAVIVTPHYTDFSSFCDPTHRWHLNSFSLRFFGDDNAGYGYYSKARFREISTYVKLLSLWRYVGFEFLVNQSRWFRRFWEFYLCYIVRGKFIEWQLEAVKEAAGRSNQASSSGS